MGSLVDEKFSETSYEGHFMTRGRPILLLLSTVSTGWTITTDTARVCVEMFGNIKDVFKNISMLVC